jgi:pimeloyl-ACP methyl ester carboxylesterase
VLDAMAQSSMARSDAEAFEGCLDAWANAPFAERIQGKTLPVLVVAGEHDPALGAETCRATGLQHYPDGRLEVVSNAGHCPMDETPVALATEVQGFLREVVPAEG